MPHSTGPDLLQDAEVPQDQPVDGAGADAAGLILRDEPPRHQHVSEDREVRATGDVRLFRLREGVPAVAGNDARREHAAQQRNGETRAGRERQIGR